LSAGNFSFGEGRVDTREGLDHPYFHRFFGAGTDRKRRGDINAPGQTAFKQRPARDRTRTKLIQSSHHWLHAKGSVRISTPFGHIRLEVPWQVKASRRQTFTRYKRRGGFLQALAHFTARIRSH